MTRPDRAMRFAAGLHRVAMRALPAGFREEYGEEVQAAFEARANSTSTRRGRLALAGLTLRAVIDTARVALRERGLTPSGAFGVGGRSVVGEAGDEGSNRTGGGGEMLEALFRDVILAGRVLRKRPMFTAVAVSTLALGIGANTAIFSVVSGVVLKPLPFPESEQLVRVYHVNTGTGHRRGSFSLPDREEWAERSGTLSALAVYSTLPSGPLLTGGDEPVEVNTAYVSSDFFDVFSREAQIGRVLLDDEEYGDNHRIVLSHGFWERRFGADESVVGTTIRLDDTGYLVTGVMPPDFTFPNPGVEAWVFLTVIPSSSIPLAVREVRFLEAVGRIEPGVSHDQAASELSAVAASLAAEYPEDNGNLDEAELVPLRETMTASVGETLYVLLGVVGMVLLIACANVANLLLSRGLERTHELEVRAALGAGRGRLVGQLMAESMLLAGVGGVAGVAIAVWGTDLLMNQVGGLLPRAEEVGIDGPVFLFALLLTLATALVFGLLPAARITRNVGTLRSRPVHGGRSGPSGRGTGPQMLVGAQVGLATVVVIASGLLLRSLWELQRVDVGLDTDRLAVLSLTINDARYPERPDYLGAYARLMERLSGVPGVESVASIRFLPLRQDGESVSFEIEGHASTSSGDRPRGSRLQVSPGFFRTAGVTVLAGREFTVDDRLDASPVVVVNDALRRRYFEGRSPIDATIVSDDGQSMRVVGVVGDVRQTALSSPALPTLYMPQAQNPRRGMSFVLRAESDPEALLPAVRDAVRVVDPDQPIDVLSPMGDVLSASSGLRRFFSHLLAGFAALSLLLASVGIYGVVAHAVSRRVSEIGLRVALGAPRTDLLRLMIGAGMRPVLVGAAIGTAAAFGLTRSFRDVLFGIESTDAVTFASVPVLLLATALLACGLPALRATRIDPTEALRAE